MITNIIDCDNDKPLRATLNKPRAVVALRFLRINLIVRRAWLHIQPLFFRARQTNGTIRINHCNLTYLQGTDHSSPLEMNIQTETHAVQNTLEAMQCNAMQSNCSSPKPTGTHTYRPHCLSIWLFICIVGAVAAFILCCSNSCEWVRLVHSFRVAIT